MNRNRIVAALAVITAAIALAGCVHGNVLPSPPAGPAQHLYVVDAQNTVSHILKFNLPLSGSSAPTVSDSVSSALKTVKIDSNGALYVLAGTATSTLTIYPSPLLAGSVAATTIPVASGSGDLAFDASGNLYVSSANTNSVQVYSPPFTSSSVPTFSITNGISTPFGITFDPAGDLYVANATTIAKFAPPFSAASVPITFGSVANNFGLACDAAGNLYVSNGSTDGSIDVYAAPIVASSVAAYHLSLPSGSTAFYPTFDARGNLYVSAQVAPNAFGSIFVFKAPLTSTSVFSTRLDDKPTGLPLGLVVGP